MGNVSRSARDGRASLETNWSEMETRRERNIAMTESDIDYAATENDK